MFKDIFYKIFFLLQVLRTPRPRRNRQWQLGMIFLIYSLMAVLSQETAVNKDTTDASEDGSSDQNPEDFTPLATVSIYID